MSERMDETVFQQYSGAPLKGGMLAANASQMTPESL